MRAGTLLLLASLAPLGSAAAQPAPPAGSAAAGTPASTATAPPAPPPAAEAAPSAAPATAAPAPANQPSAATVPPASTAETPPAPVPAASANPAPANGSTEPSAGQAASVDVRDAAPTSNAPSAHLHGSSPLGIGLNAYGGLTALFDVGTRGAYSFLGGSLRARYRYFTAGGYYELSDSPETRSGEWWGAGGSAGVWLPYDHWVDFQLALRAGFREYSDQDPRFGVGGYRVGGPTLGMLLGVSDRSRTGVWAGRLGGAVFAAYDLTQHDRDWRYEVAAGTSDPVVFEGTSHIGGLSLGLLVELGIDVEP